MTTDQLPRQIPSDPAEQEAQMPQWVKEATVRAELFAGVDCSVGNVNRQYEETFAHALTIWKWCPEPVDPDLQMAREVCAEIWPQDREGHLSGLWDSDNTTKACLAMAKRVREAKQ